ncbi:LysM peptidoglycan-binding domain-containing protein [Ruania alkalisoli]|uniref:LysM peptidoglycan-binding domain-containing protein n=1 Tax=Ruania alkalisoli TaxID=2779775 RepID=UPI001FE4CB77|nr:LysM peptidoglycan-binding domain-containing protein [Ruania alkalisoli]
MSSHPARSAEGRLRLTVRGQIVLSVLALVVAAGIGSLLGLALPADEALPSEVATVTVGPGESLWGIAQQAAGPGEDVRVVIDQIMTLNSLADSTVHAGQQLSIPVEG